MWPKNLYNRINNFFFLFLTLSMIALVFFSKQLFNLFFFQFCSLFFWLLFFLFEIIHEIIFLLISSSFNFFHLSYLVPIIFIAIFFFVLCPYLDLFSFSIQSFFFNFDTKFGSYSSDCYFFSWFILFFNFIPRCFISFIFYIRFGS
jgi:hypothetical protein